MFFFLGEAENFLNATWMIFEIFSHFISPVNLFNVDSAYCLRGRKRLYQLGSSYNLGLDKIMETPRNWVSWFWNSYKTII